MFLSNINATPSFYLVFLSMSMSAAPIPRRVRTAHRTMQFPHDQEYHSWLCSRHISTRIASQNPYGGVVLAHMCQHTKNENYENAATSRASYTESIINTEIQQYGAHTVSLQHATTQLCFSLHPVNLLSCNLQGSYLTQHKSGKKSKRSILYTTVK